MEIQIPGRTSISFAHLVLDYNGTIARDGQVLWDITPALQQLSEQLSIHVLTADTFGTVHEQCAHLPVAVETFPSGTAAESKRDIVGNLEGGVCCFGNGYNDRLMFEAADLSIGIIEQEGMSTALITCADVVVTRAKDAFELLVNPQRLVATLRG